MLWTRRGLFFKTGEGGGGTGGAGEEQPPRKAEQAAVDQIVDHEERLERLEGGFLDRIAKAMQPKAAAAPATGEVKPPVSPPRARGVVDELADCLDPFRLFDETPPPKKPEAPATDGEAAA